MIAAITSCTNTSNPSVMVGAALLAKKAVEAGLSRKPWVKTTLAPGSKVVMDYYERAGLTPYLEKLGFNLVGYGCTTCIGNSGPLPEAISAAVAENDLAVVVGAVRQPQLRGPDQPGREDELPGLAAAGGGVRAGRHDGLRHEPRAARLAGRRQPGVPGATSGRPRRRSPPWCRTRSRPRCSAGTTPTCSRATTAGARWTCRPGTPSPGARTPPTCGSRRTSRACRTSPRRSATSTAPACWPCWATR